MASKPLPLDEFCWPPNGGTTAGPIGYGPDGSIMVGSNYGDTGFDLDVEGDEFTFQQNTYNDSIIQNFEIVRETLNNTINFNNDNSVTVGPVESFFEVTENITNEVTNMGDVTLEGPTVNIDTNLDAGSVTIEGPEGGGPGSYGRPRAGPSVMVALTKSPISGGAADNVFVPGSGIASLLYRRPSPALGTQPSEQSNIDFARMCRRCTNEEQRLGRNHLAVIACWELANHMNPYGFGNVRGSSAPHYEEPQGGLSNISFGYGPQAAAAVQNAALAGVPALTAAAADDPQVIARQLIVTVFNISPCTIERNKIVLVGRETEHRYWIIAEACDECPP